MLKVLSLLVVIPALLLLCSCGNDGVETIKLVAIGDSSTMGTQDGGLLIDFQLNCYPYLIAKQMGIADEFEQPLVNPPGIGVFPFERPLQLENGELIFTFLPEDTQPTEIVSIVYNRLANSDLPRPYNNLAVNGARLHDIRNTTSYLNSVSPGNYFFDIVLRNLQIFPYPLEKNTTILEQAVQLNPEIILLWIGGNDILNAVRKGGDETEITSPDDFRSEYILLLEDLCNRTDASIITANIPGYLPIAFALDTIFVNGKPVLFDLKTLTPIDFSDVKGAPDPLYIPLMVEESNATHIPLDAGIAYSEQGMGIPDQDDLKDMLIASNDSEAQDFVDAMETHGLNTNGSDFGEPLSDEYSITDDEEQLIRDAVEALNAIISELALQYGIPLVDIHSVYDPDGPNPYGGFYSGEFVLHDQDNTIFSLDGVHPNNLGHAVIANTFIDTMNEALALNIPKLNPEDYRGQYSGLGVESIFLTAVKGVKNEPH